MKKFFKILNLIKKPFVFIFNFIKNKSQKPREFLRTGRPGGIIACHLVATQFFTWLFYEMAINKIPRVFLSVDLDEFGDTFKKSVLIFFNEI